MRIRLFILLKIKSNSRIHIHVRRKRVNSQSIRGEIPPPKRGVYFPRIRGMCYPGLYCPKVNLLYIFNFFKSVAAFIRDLLQRFALFLKMK